MAFALVFVGEVLRVALEDRPPTRTTALLQWIRAWVLGRRIWLTWAVATMGGSWLVMNIGQFQTVMLTACLVYFRGEEVARVVARIRGDRRPIPELHARRLAYGAATRVGLVGLLAWHVTAVIVWLVPEHASIAGVRTEARALV